MKISASVITLALAALTFTVLPAQATERATVVNVASNTSASVAYRGGVTAAVTLAPLANPVTGGSTAWLSGTGTHRDSTDTGATSAGTASGYFGPTLDTSANVTTFGLDASAGMCNGLDYSGYCDAGTMTITFNQPVTNPVLDVSGLGAHAECGWDEGANLDCPTFEDLGIDEDDLDINGNDQFVSGAFLSQQLQLLTPGVTFGSASGGSTNLSVTPTTVSTVNKSADIRCDNSGPKSFDVGNETYQLGTAAPAGCGSVTLQGTFTSVQFQLGTWVQKMPTANGFENGFNVAGTNRFTLDDYARYSIRLQEDLGDAPASYDVPGGQAALHYAGPLKLGSTFTNDQLTVSNPTVSANASSGANLDTDDAIGDGITAPPATWGQVYTQTIPLSGTASGGGTVGGWIDFNGNGVFDVAERATATFAAGATSAVLTWTLPSSATPRDTYLRLRTSFTAAQASNPTGIATSGEVEDYKIRIDVPAPDINISKAPGTVTGPDQYGDYVVTYTVEVENSGSGAGTYGALTDTPTFPTNTVRTRGAWTTSGAGAPANGSANTAGPYTLAPANTAIAAGVTHTYNVAITYHYTNSSVPADCAAGPGLSNSVAVPAGQEQGPSTDNTACVDPLDPPAPGITVIKKINGQDANTAPGVSVPVGSPMTITFEVTNTGDVQLTNVTLSDNVLPGASITPPAGWTGTLAPGATAIFTAAFPAPASGGVLHTNTATVVGTPPYGQPDVTDDDPANATTTSSPAITVIKKINGDDANTAPGVSVPVGSPLSVTFDVTNTGNVTLTGVKLADDVVPAGAIVAPTSPANWDGSLVPGQTVQFTATFPAPATGGVLHTNTATATGTPPTGTDVTDDDPANATTTSLPAITVIKKINGDDANTAPGVTVAAGANMAITFEVTNTGNVTLTDVTLADNVIPAGAIVAPTTPANWDGSLAPGTSVTFTATFPAPANGGVLHTNVATATGTPPTGAPVTDDDPANATTTPAPELELDKRIVQNGVVDAQQ